MTKQKSLGGSLAAADASCKTAAVDALAAAAQTDPAAKNALWYAVRRWACSVALRYRPWLDAGGGAWCVDDLVQCAGVGVLEALQTYDRSRGGFLAWCKRYVQTACGELLGLRGRQRRENYNMVSLDAPLDDSGEICMGDLIEDPASADAFDAADHRAWCDTLRADIMAAMGKLPDPPRQSLQRCDLDGLTMQQAAEERGVTMGDIRRERIAGLNALRRDPYLRKTYAPATWRHKTLAAFRHTMSSVVEDIAIRNVMSEQAAQYTQPERRPESWNIT